MPVETLFDGQYSPDKNIRVQVRNAEVEATLTYPDLGRLKYVLINQESVRASDGLRLHYDYTRDGFVIEQASRFGWDISDTVCDPDWQEVAFIKAWAREETDDELHARLEAVSP